jgi:hypothetical protein
MKILKRGRNARIFMRIRFFDVNKRTNENNSKGKKIEIGKEQWAMNVSKTLKKNCKKRY